MKRNGLAVLAGIALTAAMVPSPARASIPETACSSSALKVCSAVRFSVANAGTVLNPDWQVTVWAWNLFGNGTYGAGSLANVLTYVGLASSTWSGEFTLASATYAGNSVAWSAATNLPHNLGAALDLGASSNNGINNGLIGCSQTQFGSQLNTCYSKVDSALVLVFNTYHKVGNNLVSSEFTIDPTNPNSNYWEVHSQLTNCSLWLNSNGASTNDAGTGCTTTVVPEPISMALVGTGLLGMGLARIRRRKKNGDIESV